MFIKYWYCTGQPSGATNTNMEWKHQDPPLTLAKHNLRVCYKLW